MGEGGPDGCAQVRDVMRRTPTLIHAATVLALVASACTPVATPAPTATSIPPTTTLIPAVTSAPIGPRAVTFTTADGVTLNGTLDGSGAVAVIFSNMGDKRQASWADFAQAVADEGYLTLTYDFRYWVNGKIQNSLLKYVAADLSAAASFVRGQGVQTVVMVGASVGGMATAKAAADSEAAAIIILAAPMDASNAGVVVALSELQAITTPKLFITSENDKTVDADALREMYTLAVDPKELVVYPGTAHGTDLFQTASGPELQLELLEFIQLNAPAR